MKVHRTSVGRPAMSQMPTTCGRTGRRAWGEPGGRRHAEDVGEPGVRASSVVYNARAAAVH